MDGNPTSPIPRTPMEGMAGSQPRSAQASARVPREACLPARLARVSVLAAGLAALLLCVLSTSAQETAREVIGDVRIVGNRTVPTEQVMRHVNLRPGQDY